MRSTLQSAGLRSDQAINNIFDQIKYLQERVGQLERYALSGSDLQASKAALGDLKIGSLTAGDFAASGVIYNRPLGFGDLASVYLALPMLKGFWPLTISGGYNVATINDISGNGLALTNPGCTLAYYDSDDETGIMIPVCEFGGTVALYRNDEDAFRIPGTESNVAEWARGIAAGAWVRTTQLTEDTAIIGQWDRGGSTNQKAWVIYFDYASGKYKFCLSSDGSTTSETITSSTAAIEDRWQFVCGAWTPYTDHGYIWVDNEVTVGDTTISAIHNSTAPFMIGAQWNNSSGELYWHGAMANAFLLCGYPGDDLIRLVYQLTRTFYKHKELT